MDFTAVATAGVLLAILLGWYALLEYEDRRLRKGAWRSKRPGGFGGGRPSPGRAEESGAYATRQNWRSDGRPPRAGRPPTARTGRRLAFSRSYGLAVVVVLVALVLVTPGDPLFSSPPLVFFAAAVAAAFALGGRGPGLLALLSATLLGDFFFVEPTFVFSMDWQVLRLSLAYLLVGLLSVFISQRLSPGDPAE